MQDNFIKAQLHKSLVDDLAYPLQNVTSPNIHKSVITEDLNSVSSKKD